MLEDLVVAAVNEALRKSVDLQTEEMGKSPVEIKTGLL